MEIWWSSDKNNFAQFFETRCSWFKLTVAVVLTVVKNVWLTVNNINWKKLDRTLPAVVDRLMWPWPLPYWPQNLISISVDPNTSVTKIGWNSHWFLDMMFTRFSGGTDSRTHSLTERQTEGQTRILPVLPAPFFNGGGGISRWNSTGFRRRLCLWPWALTFWSEKLISTSMSQFTSEAKNEWNSFIGFYRATLC